MWVFRKANMSMTTNDQNFVLAFPKHYPYGYGGPETTSETKEGSFRKFHSDKYIKHVTNLSNIAFSEPLFTLAAFNLYQRHRMLNNCAWRVRTKEGRSDQITDLTPDEVITELCTRKAISDGLASTVNASRSAAEFIDTVQCISSCLPHTNDAAKKG